MKIGGGALHILSEGKNKKFVASVQQVTYSGEYGASIRQEVLYVTERTVFRLSADGLVLTEIGPSLDLQKDILDQMDFVPMIAEPLAEMDPRIFRAEPMGLRIGGDAQ